MRKLYFILITVISFITISCTPKDKCTDTICPVGTTCVDGTCVGSTTNTIINTNITTNTVWTRDKIYELSGRITVVDGVNLFIEAGTIIKGQTGTGANASALLIARGAKIVAVGNPDSPIIFTSVADEISIEDVNSKNFNSPNLLPSIQGLWGGLIILGKAPISASANEIQIEGIPTTDANGLYGGNIPNDNSGIVKYVSIRHGGANIGNGNEINGLTLGGVGSGTIIENIEIVGNQDDGIEFFGGTVSVKNVIIWNSGDDAIDTDQAWSGTLDNLIIICGDATDHALEIDGAEGTYTASNHIINASIKGHANSELADFRACAMGSFENIYFFNFPDPAMTSGRGDFSLTNPSSSSCTTDNLSNNILIFRNLQISLASGLQLSNVFLNGTHTYASNITTRTVGADKLPFQNWTWSFQYTSLIEF